MKTYLKVNFILTFVVFLTFNTKLISQEYFSFYSWTPGQLSATNWRSDPNQSTFAAYTGCLYADVNITNSAPTGTEWQGSGSGANPKYNYNTNGMPATAGFGMLLGPDWTNSSRIITYTITFKSSSGGPVTEYPADFSIYDINAHPCGVIATLRYIDMVSVVGYKQDLSTVVIPTYADAANGAGVTCTANVVTGNWIKGSGNCGSNRTNVTFPSNVARIVITYTSGIGHPAALACGTSPGPLVAGDNPKSQEIYLSAFRINNPGAPTAPTAITGGASICLGNSIALTGTGASATSRWFTGLCNGTAAGTGASINVSPTSNTTYFVANVGGLCGTTLSACSSQAITVNPLSTITTQPASTSACSTGSAILSVSAPAGPYQWQYFNGSTWGNVVNGTPTGFTYAGNTTNSLGVTTSGASTGVYQFRNVVGSGCSINSSSANLTITGPPTTGMVAGDWVWTGAQSIIYELAGNWLSWNGTVLSVPANPPSPSNNVRIKPTVGCVLNPPTITNAAVTNTALTTSANCNDIIIESGATLTYTNTALPSNPHLYINGNYNNQGTVVSGTGRVKFSRTSLQNITDASGTATFYEMNVAGTSITNLINSVTVTNAIRLNGVITTGANRVYLNTTAVDGASTGFVTSGGHIFGNLRRLVVSNTSNYLFPVGVSNVLTTGRRLLVWMNNNVTGITDLDCSVSNAFKGAGNNIDGQLDLPNKARSFSQVIGVVRPEAEWTLTPTTPMIGGNYGLQLYLQNFASIPDNQFTILKRDNPSANFFDFNTFFATTNIPVLNAAGRIYNTGLGYAEKTGFAAFSKFVIGTSINILPISLIDFNVNCQSNLPHINWSTATEKNNDYFELHRSSDAINFNSIYVIPGAGNSFNLQSYSYIDDSPLPGISYYKLSQTDLDGTKTDFPIKSYQKNCSNSTFNIVALTNPFDNKLTLSLKHSDQTQITLSIYDNFGQLVKTIFDKTILDGETTELTVDTEKLAQSVYYLCGSVNNEPINLKLIKM